MTGAHGDNGHGDIDAWASGTSGESGPNDALLEKYGLTARHMAQAARELLARVRG